MPTTYNYPTPPQWDPDEGYEWKRNPDGTWSQVKIVAPAPVNPRPSSGPDVPVNPSLPVHAIGSSAPAPSAAPPTGFHWEEAPMRDGTSQGWQLVKNGTVRDWAGEAAAQAAKDAREGYTYDGKLTPGTDTGTVHDSDIFRPTAANPYPPSLGPYAGNVRLPSGGFPKSFLPRSMRSGKEVGAGVKSKPRWNWKTPRA